MSSENKKIDFEPIGKRIDVSDVTTILEAAHLAGIDLVAVCGGAGSCGQCQVQIISDHLPPPNSIEKSFFSSEKLSNGWRLACQTTIRESLKIHIPAESLSTPQRLQLEGLESDFDFTSSLEFIDIELPTSEALASNRDVSANAILSMLPYPLPEDHIELKPSFLAALENEHGKLRIVAKDGKIIHFQKFNEPVYGLAVDLGTTKIAAYLVNLETRSVEAKTSAPNPQIRYGEDVISRILFCMENEDGIHTMQNLLVTTLNSLIKQMCEEVQARSEQIIASVVVGNTAMHHFFTGLPVRQLGLSPYSPAVTHSMNFKPGEIGLSISSNASIYLPENIAGYVGGDHVAMAVATKVVDAQDIVLALDIGTNTEISLVKHGKIYTCSCASGPAFEGAHIQDGMRAADGAIERISIEEEHLFLSTIGGKKPIGICGSGILDVIAEMRKSGIIDERGNFDGRHQRVRGTGKNTEFLLVPAEESGSTREIVITRKDVNEILLAKAAIQTGIEILIRTAGISPEQIDRFIVAGAFGTYLDINSAKHIGMFPNLPIERFKQVGNAAGSGARMMVMSDEVKKKGSEFSDRSMYVELTLYPDFQKIYMQSLRFPALKEGQD